MQGKEKKWRWLGQAILGKREKRNKIAAPMAERSITRESMLTIKSHNIYQSLFCGTPAVEHQSHEDMFTVSCAL